MPRREYSFYSVTPICNESVLLFNANSKVHHRYIWIHFKVMMVNAPIYLALSPYLKRISDESYGVLF